MPPRPSSRRDPAALARAFEAAVGAQDWAGAVAALDALVSLAPGNAALHYNRALALRQGGRPAEALAAAETALALEPAHRKAPFERAAALMDCGDFCRAAEAFAGVLAAAPGDDEAACNLGRCRLALGDAAGALVAVEGRGGAEAVAVTAEALRDLGRLDEAEGWLRTLAPARALKLRTHGAIGRLPMRVSALGRRP